MPVAGQGVDVYLGLGSNLDPHRHIEAGFRALHETFGKIERSPIYVSAAVGFSGADFLNAVARIQTDWPVRRLKSWLTGLENEHGRDRSQPKFSDRSLDIDILLHGDQQGEFDGLVLPRAEILEHAHVLKPLADIAPDLVHPATGCTIAEHWRRFRGDRSLAPAAAWSDSPSSG